MDFVYQWVRERSQQATGEIKMRLTEEVRNDLINEYGFNEILSEFVALLKNYSVKRFWATIQIKNFDEY